MLREPKTHGREGVKRVWVPSKCWLLPNEKKSPRELSGEWVNRGVSRENDYNDFF